MQLSHVFLQIEIPTESFGAYFARVGFLVIVGMHVECEIVDLVEGFVANVTLVCFFSAVRQLMVLVIALLMEPFAAVFANKWLVSSMNSSVSVKR